MLEYELIRSNRKTLAICVRRDGRIEVRAPFRTSKSYINDFVLKKQDWIENTRSRLSARQAEKKTIRITAKEEARLKKQAKAYLQQKCLHFARLMELQPGEVKINSAKTRWGSCNRMGGLNFTYRLLFTSEEVIDYVVVHELAHLKEMNHSPRFWAVVGKTLPDYDARRKKLREFEHRIELVVVKS